MSRTRLAIVATHPIQYYAPWFRSLAASRDMDLCVFYLDNPELRDAVDPEFGTAVRWDIPLLDGYACEWIPNRARRPGSHHYAGLYNPELWPRIEQYQPSATLLMAYHYRAILPAMLMGAATRPLFLRGDSHLLGRQPGLRRKLADRVIRRAFRSLDGALFTGQHNRRYFVHHGIAQPHLHHSPPAIDLELFSPSSQTSQAAQAWRKRLGIPETNAVILFVGKFVDKKRPLDLLRAFGKANLCGCSLLFVGDGPLEDTLKQAAAQAREIYFAPFQNQSQMPQILAVADLLVLPSATTPAGSETWGLVVNEAFAMEVPAIVSDQVGCAPDLVLEQTTGSVFPATNVAALTTALGEAMRDKTRLGQWGRNARQLVTQQFSYTQMSAGLLSALDAVSAQ